MEDGSQVCAEMLDVFKVIKWSARDSRFYVVFMVLLGHVIAQDGHLGLDQTLAGGRL